MKILFLDVDGVLNSNEWIRANEQLFENQQLFQHKHLDKAAVARVDRIVRETGAKVVISSTWRRFNRLEQLQTILKNHGFTGEVIGTTPILSSKRGLEIMEWIRINGPIESFVILDDDSDMLRLIDRLVKTTFDTGLQDEHVEKAIALLMENTNGD